MTIPARALLLLTMCATAACTRPPEAEAPTAALPTTPTVIEAAWPEVASCKELPAALAQMLDQGKAPGRGKAAPLALLDLGARGYSNAAGADLIADLPVERSTADRPPTTRCTLVVDRPEGSNRVDRRSLGKTSIHSEYAANTRRRPNPEYAKLERELRRTEDGGRQEGGKLRASGILLYDLIALGGTALIGGINGYLDSQKQEELAARLKATPQQLEEQDWQGYKLQIEELALDKQAGLRVALVDNLTGESWQTARKLEESIRVALADGLHPRDRNNVEGGARRLVGPAELAELEEAPLQVKLTELLTGLAAEVGREPPRAMDLAALVRDWGQEPPTRVATLGTPAPEPGAGPSRPRATATGPARSSLVKVDGLGGRAKGFYVAPAKILTLAQALGGSSLVKVEGADGFVTWGVVQHEDAKNGIALLHVQRTGQPLPLGSAADTLARFKGDAVEAGAPLIDEGRVIGISVDPARGRAVGTAELRHFLEAAEAR